MTLENKALTYGAIKYIVAIFVFVIPIIITAVTLENRVGIIEDKNKEIDLHFSDEKTIYNNFYERLGNQDIKYAEIKATLESIKVTQSDILSRLPKYKYPVTN